MTKAPWLPAFPVERIRSGTESVYPVSKRNTNMFDRDGKINYAELEDIREKCEMREAIKQAAVSYLEGIPEAEKALVYWFNREEYLTRDVMEDCCHFGVLEEEEELADLF